MRRLTSAPSRRDSLSATAHGLGSLTSLCMNEIVASYSWTARNGPKRSKHARLGFVLKNRITSAVSTTDWIVETQLCKLRGTDLLWVFVSFLFMKKIEKSHLWVRPIEWLKLNLASCVIRQTRSLGVLVLCCTLLFFFCAVIVCFRTLFWGPLRHFVFVRMWIIPGKGLCRK